jgi:hypothetical protein
MKPLKYTTDGRPLYPVGDQFQSVTFKPDSTKGLFAMSNNNSVNEALAILATFPDEQLKEILARAPKEILPKVEAAAVEAAKKTRVARIAAMRAEGVPAFTLAQGELKRLGIAIDDVTDTLAVDKLFASAIVKPSTEKRIEIKSALRACGLIAA